MNKTVTINLSGIVFHIEEHAYEILKKYLDSIKNYFSKYDDSNEIIADIENRIAEKLTIKISNTKQAITEQDISELIASLGTAADFTSAEKEETTDEKESSSEKTGSSKSRRLFRDKNNKMIGGVASGLAAYFGIDTAWVRLFLIICLFIFGSGIVAYLILWIAMPEKDLSKEELEDYKKEYSLKGKKLFRNTDDKVIAGVASGIGSYFGIDPVWIRLLFVASLFIEGAGVILYIVLWIILPPIKSISDKIQMKGKPITLSNIESKIKESLNENKDSEKESTLVKIVLFPFRLIGVIISGIGNIVGKLLHVFTSLMTMLVGFIFIVIAISFLVSCFFLIVYPVFNIYIDGLPLIHSFPLSMLFANNWMYYLGIFSSSFALFMASILLFCAGVYFIIRKFFLNKILTFSFLSIFILCGILTAGIIVYVVSQFKNEYEINKTESLAVTDTSKIYLQLNELNEKRFQKVNLFIKGHNKEFIELTQHTEWKGSEMADEFNENGQVLYHYSLKDSVIKFDSHFTFEDKPLFRSQQVELTLLVPYNRQLRLSKNLDDILVNDLSDKNMTDISGVDWKVTEEGIVCISCDESVRLKYEPSKRKGMNFSMGRKGKKMFWINIDGDKKKRYNKKDDDENLDFNFSFDNNFTLLGGKHIKDGETFQGDLSILVGGVEIGNKSVVKGDITTNVGGISIGSNSIVTGNLHINAGGVEIENNSIVDGEIDVDNGGVEVGTESSVGSVVIRNGGIKMQEQSVCIGSIELTNGGIELNGATVNGEVSLKRGRIKVKEGSHIIGGIRVVNTDDDDDDPTEIHIYEGAYVEGKIHTEGNVELYIYEGADVTAKITGNKPIRK